MSTPFTPEQIRELVKAMVKAEIESGRGGYWIPAGCANGTCKFHEDGRCRLNDYQRQTCDCWKRPVDMPTPTQVLDWVACGLAFLAVLVAIFLIFAVKI